MKEHYCTYCGKDTYDVDIEYLIGGNHLACVLADMPELKDWAKKNTKKKKPVEISNWSKLVGNTFDVMGASFIIMDAHTDSIDEGNIYTAWINCDDTGHEVLARVTLFADNMDMQVKVCAPIGYDATMTPYDLSSTITKHHVSNPSIFIQTIAEALLSDSITRDILSYISRKQDTMRFKGRGYSSPTGINGSSGNNLW